MSSYFDFLAYQTYAYLSVVGKMLIYRTCTPVRSSVRSSDRPPPKGPNILNVDIWGRQVHTISKIKALHISFYPIYSI